MDSRRVLETFKQEATLTWERPSAVLFDMKAVFPELEHDYLHRIVEPLGLPRPLRAAVWALSRLDMARFESERAQREASETDPGVKAEWALTPL